MTTPTLIIKKISAIDDPIYAHDGDCGIDLRASGIFVVDLDGKKEEVVSDELLLAPSERILIKTGIIIEIPKGHWGSIRDRSGLAYNEGLHVLAGVIDENYRGEIGVVLTNLSTKERRIKKNDRIAQIIITTYVRPAIVITRDDVSQSNRGVGGFGSSGKQ